MKISELSVRRPVLMTMVYVLIAIIAVVYLMNIEIALYPETDMPMISIMTSCAGADSELVEQQVTRQLEDALSSVENLESMTSMSTSDSSIVLLEFDYGSDLDEAEEDIDAAITMVSRMLPDWADSPQVLRMDSIGSSTVMTLSLSGPYDTSTLQQIAEDDIAPLLERVQGVAEADAFGGGERKYEVQVHADRLQAYGLSFSDIMSALSSSNIQASGGQVLEGGVNYQISVDERFTTLDEIAGTLVKRVGDTVIRISDLADVVMTEEDSPRRSYVDGQPIVMISITAESDANETTVAQAVRSALPSIIQTLPDDLTLTIQRDSTEMIVDTMGEVYNSAWQGVLLAALVIFLFLRGFRTTLIISLSMPICILITLMCMSLAGITVNSMSMAGLILGIGMIVDASIIILENTYSFRLKGEPSAVAAILGSKDMFNAILASTLTTICVFLPLLVFKDDLGMIGVMFQDMIVTVCLSLACSLFVAMTLVPALCGSILRFDTRTQRPLKSKTLRWLDEGLAKAEDRLRDAYEVVLSYFLDHRAMLLVPLVLLLILSMTSLSDIGLSLTPQMTTDDEVTLSLTLPTGTDGEVTGDRIFDMQEKLLGLLPADAYESISLEIGSSNTGSITISLPDITRQKYTAGEVEDMIRPLLAQSDADEQWLFSSGRGMGGSAIDVEIRSDDTLLAQEVADEIVDILRSVEGTDNVESDLGEGSPAYYIRLRDDVAKDLGVTAQQVSSTLATAISGSSATELTTFSSDTTYDLDVVLYDEDIDDIDALNSLLIPTSAGTYVRLDTVADLERSTTPVTITREDRQRVNHVTASILDGYASSEVQEAVDRELAERLVVPEGVTISQGGEMTDLAGYVPVLVAIVLLALFLVYAVMAAQFESLVDPLIIFATIPLLMVGVVFIHTTWGQAFTLFSFVGIVALIGVVVNNGIVLVDWINHLVRTGKMDVRAACISAARSRLRPILMTTLTTILGLIPLAFFPGEGTEMIQPIALTFVGGITTGAFLTLLLSPVLYSILNSRRATRVANPDSLQNQLARFDERTRRGEIL